MIRIKDQKGNIREIAIAEDEDRNLMEILKTVGYNMRATCGGMGLCADCHCSILSGAEFLPHPRDQEMETLDNLPDSTPTSRLACQLMPKHTVKELFIELLGPDD